MRVVELSQAEPYAAGNLRTGNYDEKILATGKEGSPENFKLSYATATEDSTTPRHRHNFEQIRLSLSGDFQYGKNEKIPPGWVAYFPEAIPYGPQVRKEGSVTLYFQFGSASGFGFMSLRQRRQGFKDLVEKGKFENGAYTWFDEKGGKHNQDAFEAVWEKAMGREVKYVTPRYSSVALMNPEAYNWVADPKTPGVAYKWLGTFTERATRTGFIRLDAGASVTIDPKNATHILFLVSGMVLGHPPNTAFTLDHQTEAAVFKADEASVLFSIELPPVVQPGAAETARSARVDTRQKVLAD